MIYGVALIVGLAEQKSTTSWSELLSPVLHPAFIVGMALIGCIAHQNHQIHTALRELHARLCAENGTWNAMPLTRHALGPQRELLLRFLEHLRFSSANFLASVDESPANVVARRLLRETNGKLE